jgi:hypothetical protein
VNLHIRRSLVVGGVIGSLVLGVVSIRVAARLAEAAGPPPAPPISMADLTARLQEEEARAAALQAQLDDLIGVTDQLRAALSGTADQVSLDGLTADELRARLQEAESTLATVTALLADAQARLARLAAAGSGTSGGGGGGTGGGGSGTGGSGTGGATPGPGGVGSTPGPTGGATATAAPFTLSLSNSSGDVSATWGYCASTPFDSYALVRSSIAEVHWPPETANTQVARIFSQGTLSTVDTGAPSGTSWYQVYCLVNRDAEVQISRTSNMVSITLP